MPGVYKIYMVRMAEMPDELANVRVYTEERIEMYAGLKNDSQRGLVEMAVTKHLTALQALSKLTGSEQAPKYEYV